MGRWNSFRLKSGESSISKVAKKFPNHVFVRKLPHTYETTLCTHGLSDIIWSVNENICTSSIRIV
jgi:ABC-type transport system involved in Fe-S cluster assembly fused permease/ATPase subunit